MREKHEEGNKRIVCDATGCFRVQLCKTADETKIYFILRILTSMFGEYVK